LKDRLFVTGAQGFTGRHLVQLAINEGFEVIESNSDLLDVNSLSQEVNKCQPNYVVHLAAISSTISENQKLVYETNLIGSFNLLTTLNELTNKPKKVLLASSAHVYGNSQKEIFKETDELNPFNHYGVSKSSMELMARQFFHQLPIVIARPFNYTGVGHDANFVIPKIISHYKEKKSQIELGNINTEREYNDVRSVCSSYLKLLSSPVTSDIFNVCSGEVYTIRKILSILESITNYQLQVLQNPQLLRPHELKKLCGDPQKLQLTIGDFSQFTIKETLEWMLQN
jgi:nucleoside-diphosphate-sugar epimerase